MLTIPDWADGELLLSVRNKIRSALTTLNQEGHNIHATAPGSPVAGQVWTNPTTGVMYQRNTTNNAWIPVRRINGPTILTLTGTYTATANNFGNQLVFTAGTGSTTLVLPAVSTIPNGFWIDVNNPRAYRLIIDGNGAELVDRAATIDLPPDAGCRLTKVGSVWYSSGRPVSDAGTMADLTASCPLITTTIATPAKVNLVLQSATTTLAGSSVSSGNFVVPKTGSYDIYMYGRPDFYNASGGIYGVVYYDLMDASSVILSKAEGNFPLNGSIGIACRAMDFGVKLTAAQPLTFKVSGYAGTSPYGALYAHTVKVKLIYRGP